MQQYQPGDVYFCTFPKFVQIPGKKDFNIDSLKENSMPRPVAVLFQVNENRLIVAPVTGDDSSNHTLYNTFVPLKKEDYPTFLKKDSFVKLNQVQVIDKKFLYPSDSPIHVGKLKQVDLDRVRYFALYATHTVKTYTDWVTSIVQKNLKKIAANQVRYAINDYLNLPEPPRNRPQRTDTIRRGDIVKYPYQPAIQLQHQTNEKIVGENETLMFTSTNNTHIPGGQGIGIPLIPNDNSRLDLHSIHDVEIEVNNRLYRACVSQIQPLNVDWIGERVGAAVQTQMLDIDRALIDVLGLKRDVIDLSRKLIQEFQGKSNNRGSSR